MLILREERREEVEKVRGSVPQIYSEHKVNPGRIGSFRLPWGWSLMEVPNVD